MEQNSCSCGEAATAQCFDCRANLCGEHVCESCGRCETDCVCHLRWWLPEFF
jgi:hypothetical protein